MREHGAVSGVVGRLGLASGAGWVALVLVGNSLTEADAPTGRTPEAAAAYFSLLRSGSHQVGVSLELLGFCLMAVFVARLFTVLRDAEGPGRWLSGLALVGGLTTLAVKLGSAAPFVVGLAVTDLPAEQARLLLDLNDAAFLIAAMTSGLLVLGTAGCALGSGLLPRWLAVLGLPIGALAVLGSLAPTSLDGGPGVPGFLLGLLWLAAVSVLLAVRRAPSSADAISRVGAPARA